MRVSWVWVAQVAIYFGSAWIVVTTLIGAFFLGLKPSLFSAFFVGPLLLILALCLIGLCYIVNQFNETFGPRKTQTQGKGFPVRVSWTLMSLVAVYGVLAWMAAGTVVGEFLVVLMFSLGGVVVLLAALLILTLCLIANLQNRKQAELNPSPGPKVNGENRMES